MRSTELAGRVLKLIASYGAHLEDIQSSIESLNVLPFRKFVPQLVSLTKCSCPITRKTIVDVVKALADSDPEVIAFEIAFDQGSVLFKEIRAHYSKQNKALLDSTLHFIREVQQVSILPEERWYALLHSLKTDLERRFQRFDTECLRMERTSVSRQVKANMQKRLSLVIFSTAASSVNMLYDETVTNATPTRHNVLFKVNAAPRLGKFKAALQEVSPDNIQTIISQCEAVSWLRFIILIENLTGSSF